MVCRGAYDTTATEKRLIRRIDNRGYRESGNRRSHQRDLRVQDRGWRGCGGIWRRGLEFGGSVEIGDGWDGGKVSDETVSVRHALVTEG